MLPRARTLSRLAALRLNGLSVFALDFEPGYTAVGRRLGPNPGLCGEAADAELAVPVESGVRAMGEAEAEPELSAVDVAISWAWERNSAPSDNRIKVYGNPILSLFISLSGQQECCTQGQYPTTDKDKVSHISAEIPLVHRQREERTGNGGSQSACYTGSSLSPTFNT